MSSLYYKNETIPPLAGKDLKEMYVAFEERLNHDSMRTVYPTALFNGMITFKVGLSPSK